MATIHVTTMEFVIGKPKGLAISTALCGQTVLPGLGQRERDQTSKALMPCDRACSTARATVQRPGVTSAGHGALRLRRAARSPMRFVLTASGIPDALRDAGGARPPGVRSGSTSARLLPRIRRRSRHRQPLVRRAAKLESAGHLRPKRGVVVSSTDGTNLWILSLAVAVTVRRVSARGNPKRITATASIKTAGASRGNRAGDDRRRSEDAAEPRPTSSWPRSRAGGAAALRKALAGVAPDRVPCASPAAPRRRRG